MLRGEFSFSLFDFKSKLRFFFLSVTTSQGMGTTDLEKTHISPSMVSCYHTVRSYMHFIL